MASLRKNDKMQMKNSFCNNEIGHRNMLWVLQMGNMLWVIDG